MTVRHNSMSFDVVFVFHSTRGFAFYARVNRSATENCHNIPAHFESQPTFISYKRCGRYVGIDA